VGCSFYEAKARMFIHYLKKVTSKFYWLFAGIDLSIPFLRYEDGKRMK
jgi:hypothetical protein